MQTGPAASHKSLKFMIFSHNHQHPATHISFWMPRLPLLPSTDTHHNHANRFEAITALPRQHHSVLCDRCSNAFYVEARYPPTPDSPMHHPLESRSTLMKATRNASQAIRGLLLRTPRTCYHSPSSALSRMTGTIGIDFKYEMSGPISELQGYSEAWRVINLA